MSVAQLVACAKQKEDIDMSSWPLLFALILVVPPVWKILSRVGYSGWWSLLALIPIVNLIALWMFAFGQWPSSPR
jgi:uncharacterized membrane protein YhaH (DUF805 family)